MALYIPNYANTWYSVCVRVCCFKLHIIQAKQKSASIFKIYRILNAATLIEIKTMRALAKRMGN